MHPLAWWAWVVGAAVATTRTGTTAAVALVLAVVVAVVLVHRGDSPWGRAFPAYLALGLVVVLLRLGVHLLVGLKAPGTVVLDLPRVTLPEWAAGIQVLGPVTLEGLGRAAADGLRLAALIVCFGAGNALTDPRRTLRTLPAALHQAGSAVVVAVSVAPHLVAAVAATRRARRLRPTPVRRRAVVGLVVPVLADALDRSLALAASMDARGYARVSRGAASPLAWAAVVGALAAAAVGTYALLDGTAPAWARLPMLLTAVVLGTVGTLVAGRSVRRTRYRPDRWTTGATSLVLAGVAAAAAAHLLPGSLLPVLAVAAPLAIRRASPVPTSVPTSVPTPVPVPAGPPPVRTPAGTVAR